MADRLAVIGGHLRGAPEIRTKAFPEKRHTVLKWNGWGYKDCAFHLRPDGVTVFKGGQCVFFSFSLSCSCVPNPRRPATPRLRRPGANAATS